MLMAVTLAVQNVPTQAAAANPFIEVLHTSMGSLGTALVWVCVGAMWFCGLASVTSNSRMVYAFARDGGLPLSKQLAQVSRRFRSPHSAIWVSVAMAFAITVWSEDAYTLMAALSTVALYASYGLPILMGLRARRRGWPRTGPWHLGRYGALVNVIALLWVAFMLVVMSLPPNGKAGITFMAVAALLFAAWFAGVRRSFRGPSVILEARTAKT
jgi:amino acid transporter